jgi:hypothetical protein
VIKRFFWPIKALILCIVRLIFAFRALIGAINALIGVIKRFFWPIKALILCIKRLITQIKALKNKT